LLISLLLVKLFKLSFHDDVVLLQSVVLFKVIPC